MAVPAVDQSAEPSAHLAAGSLEDLPLLAAAGVVGPVAASTLAVHPGWKQQVLLFAAPAAAVEGLLEMALLVRRPKALPTLRMGRLELELLPWSRVGRTPAAASPT